MDSDYIDTTPAWADLDTVNSLEDDTMYQLQCTGGGMPEMLDDAPPVYLVIAMEEPSNRVEALKSATVLRPGRDTFLYTPAADRNAWICSPTGDSSLSINATS